MAKVGVIGATGLVGTQMLSILAERKFPVDELRAFASTRSIGRKIPFDGGELDCQELTEANLAGLDFVIVDVDDPIAEQWAPKAAAAGAKVIDNSAAFRMDEQVPLVVAEVNPSDLNQMPKGIASCPNCTTMVLVLALAPLQREVGIERLVVSTYQSVSGAGQVGVDELAAQWAKGADRLGDYGSAATQSDMLNPGEVWPRPIAGNVIPLAGSLKEGGYTSEEWKLVRESQKILHAPELAVSATCVRVPVFVGHAMSANLRFKQPTDVDQVTTLLKDAPGVSLVDDGQGFPTPLESAGIDPVLVGRIRQDPFDNYTINLWVTGDNLRKGAALNAVQMAELLL